MLRRILLLLIISSAVSGCASIGPYTVELADPPEYFVENNINPLEDVNLENNIIPVFYATNRMEWEEGESKYYFYKNKRDLSLNVGKAHVQFGKDGTSWEDLKNFITMEGKRPKYSLRVIGVDEYGALNFARRRFDPKRGDSQHMDVDDRLKKEINEQLAKGDKKNITIFVHGVSVPFDDPVLVAAQLNYYGGFNGVPIGFSWPTQQRALSYLVDVEQTQFAARYLSFLLLFLSRETNVEQINIIAHSAGSRVLSKALTDISLLSGFESDRQENLKKYKIGNVVFAGGDVSRDVMGVNIEYGMIEVASKVIIYFSKYDKALGLSNWLWKQGRIGDLDTSKHDMTDYGMDYLKSLDRLELVDATGTPGSDKQFGHVYFLTSRWVSSDLMLFMQTNFPPEKRGLVRDDSGLFWEFPKNYETRSTYRKVKDRLKNKL